MMNPKRWILEEPCNFISYLTIDIDYHMILRVTIDYHMIRVTIFVWRTPLPADAKLFLFGEEKVCFLCAAVKSAAFLCEVVVNVSFPSETVESVFFL